MLASSVLVLNQLNSLHIIRNNLKTLNATIKNVSNIKFSSQITIVAGPTALKKQKVSKAMTSYLERAKQHDEFIKAQTLEYQIGKRHLANMMGEDSESFTQEDVDNAIEYLFPSGLFDKKARPLMNPPEQIFPARKAAEFDETGRPFHNMFYTGKPNFFKLLYDIVQEINKVNVFEERMLAKGNQPDPNLQIDNTGYEWLSKIELESMLVERIADLEYNNFVQAMHRLSSLSYSYKSNDLIEKLRKPLMDKTKKTEIPKPQFDESGRQYITTYECLRKRARADVTVRLPGTGKLCINGKDITYFENLQPREQVC